MKDQNVWNSILEQVQTHVNIQGFNTWLKPTSLNHNGDSQLYVNVPNHEFQQWIQENYHAQILQVAREKFGIETITYVPEVVETPEPPPAAIGKPQPKPSQQLCPVVPEGAWYGTAKEYRNVVHPTTCASDNYHLAGFLHAAGAGLGKTVYWKGGGKDQIYPNMFIGLVGRSSFAHKGTCINLSEALALESNPDVDSTDDIASAQGLISDLKEHQNNCTLMACMQELRDLIAKSHSKGLQGLMPQLCKLYDSPPVVSVRRINNPISPFKPPMFSIFAGCAPRWLEGLREEDIEGGIGNRVMFVAGEPREFIDDPPLMDVEGWKAVVSRLSDSFNYWKDRGSTRMQIGDDARKLWADFCRRVKAPHVDFGLVTVMNGRADLHAAKTAMIYAALDRSDTIQAQHLKPAIAFADFLFDCLVYIFKDFGASDWVKDEHRILDIIREKGKITKRLLRRHFFSRMSAEWFEKHLRPLAGQCGDQDKPIWIIQHGIHDKQTLAANPDWPWDDHPEVA